MELVQLYENNFRDVPAMLRRFADDIEAGKHGEVSRVATVMVTDSNGVERVEVFGWGKTEYWDTLGILGAGVHKLHRMIV